MKDLSFQEKQIIFTLISALVIFGSYFVISFSMLAQPEVPEFSIIFLFIFAVAVMIAVQVGIHTIIALFAKHEEPDERDELIELKATKISYFVLVVGIWVTASTPLFWSSTFMILNLMILAFMLSAVVGQVAQLVMYRRGA